MYEYVDTAREAATSRRWCFQGAIGAPLVRPRVSNHWAEALLSRLTHTIETNIMFVTRWRHVSVEAAFDGVDDGDDGGGLGHLYPSSVKA